MLAGEMYVTDRATRQNKNAERHVPGSENKTKNSQEHKVEEVRVDSGEGVGRVGSPWIITEESLKAGLYALLTKQNGMLVLPKGTYSVTEDIALDMARVWSVADSSHSPDKAEGGSLGADAEVGGAPPSSAAAAAAAPGKSSGGKEEEEGDPDTDDNKTLETLLRAGGGGGSGGGRGGVDPATGGNVHADDDRQPAARAATAADTSAAAGTHTAPPGPSTAEAAAAGGDAASQQVAAAAVVDALDAELDELLEL
mmetsp:Transcript_33252/g.61805  ORF Transcript_33252/g.61805 Transcript_33252/m.61805 type:complete len:254 (-) Transcript_33252:228-989(-)